MTATVAAIFNFQCDCKRNISSFISSCLCVHVWVVLRFVVYTDADLSKCLLRGYYNFAEQQSCECMCAFSRNTIYLFWISTCLYWWKPFHFRISTYAWMYGLKGMFGWIKWWRVFITSFRIVKVRCEQSESLFWICFNLPLFFYTDMRTD